jgi:hypothetical protein
MKSKQIAGWATLALTVAVLAACGGDYYQVTDVGSGKTYYTRNVDRDDGHVEFTDKATGDEVSLEKFELREVTRQQYENAVRR